MRSERGAISGDILLIIMLVVVGVLVYVFAGNSRRGVGRNIGLVSPELVATDAGEGAAQKPAVFSDALGRPNQTTAYQLDEFGAGVAGTDVFIRDINGDGRPDRITRTRIENGTDHYYDEYAIELRNGDGYVDITPDDFRTIEGAECSLQKIQFVFEPVFRVIKISRPWRDSWTTPTMATKTTYELTDGLLRETGIESLQYVCDVASLF